MSLHMASRVNIQPGGRASPAAVPLGAETQEILAKLDQLQAKLDAMAGEQSKRP